MDSQVFQSICIMVPTTEQEVNMCFFIKYFLPIISVVGFGIRKGLSLCESRVCASSDTTVSSDHGILNEYRVLNIYESKV